MSKRKRLNNSNNRDSLQKAKGYAFLLLKFRLRSEREIYERLKKKKFNEEIIRETLLFLKSKNFVDDNNFSKAWIESRLANSIGLIRLKQELRLKGIDEEIIDSQISQVKDNYSEEDIVTKIAKDKFKKLPNLEPQKAKRRIYAYLLRRGFSPGVVIDVINSYEDRCFKG
ncbi:MAG: recombination regulator RecX [Candidatus Omnitrophica bacterium]|nr:recombination regulator RecX [Candidatus Omnitrophota bacterium]